MNIKQTETLGGEILMLDIISLFIKVCLCVTQTCICWAVFFIICPGKNDNTCTHKKTLLLRFKEGMHQSQGQHASESKKLFWIGSLPPSSETASSRAIWSALHAWRSDAGVQMDGFLESSLKTHASNP